MKKRAEFLPLLGLIVPLLTVGWLYRQTVGAHFNWEDAMVVGDAAKALTRGNLAYLFTPWYGGYARLFWQFLTTLFYKFFGYNAAPFYLFSLSLHLLNVFLTYILALKLTNSKPAAFFSSFLYGVGQVNLSVLTWISAGIKDLPMTTFFLISFYFFLNSQNRKKPFSSLPIYLSYFFFALSLSCEFKAICIPAVFVAYEILCGKRISASRLRQKVFSLLPYFLVEFVFLITFYKQTFGLFSPSHNWSSWQTFIASLPLYLLPLSRIFWLKVYTNAHGLTANHSDELYLKEFGAFIFILSVFFLILLLLRKKIKRFSILSFLLLAVFLNFLPVVMLVFSNHHTLWAAITVHWRYFTLPSPLAAIFFASLFFWANEEIYGILKPIKSIFFRIFLIPLKLSLPPLALISILIFFFIQSDKALLDGSLMNWTRAAKSRLLFIRRTYPVFPPNSALIIEGTDKEELFPFFQNRYLYDNLFALYANPNNPNFIGEQQSLPLNPNEGSSRSYNRLLYYTNLKDILVGKIYHFYRSDKDNQPTAVAELPWLIPAHDRLFLYLIYGFYDKDKIFVFAFDQQGQISDVTGDRRKEADSLLKYFCFNKGRKECYSRAKKGLPPPKEITQILSSFSPLGRKIITYLIQSKAGPLPPLEKIPLPSNP